MRAILTHSYMSDYEELAFAPLLLFEVIDARVISALGNEKEGKTAVLLYGRLPFIRSFTTTTCRSSARCCKYIGNKLLG